MRCFCFSDYLEESEYPDGNYDISGEDYIDLIDTCFKYSSYFSFRRYNHDIINWTPKPVLYPNTKDLCFVSILFDGCIDLLDVFECNERTLRFLKNYTEGVFYWYNKNTPETPINMPEDLAFYRGDGSVLLFSMTHEGDVMLFLRDDENFSQNTKKPGWRERTDYKTEMFDPGWLFSKKMVYEGSAFPAKLLDSIKNYVWIVPYSEKVISECQNKGNIIIGKKFLCLGKECLRILSEDCPGEGAFHDYPTLRDYYEYTFGKKHSSDSYG